MKTTGKTILALFVSLLLGNLVSAQEQNGKIWVTVKNTEDLPIDVDGRLISSDENIQNFINNHGVFRFEQAVPDSKMEKLQKVYEVECMCDWNDLVSGVEKTGGELSDPQRAPEYSFLNSPDDYTLSFAQDYALDLINAEGAWDITTGDPNIVLGISDGGFFLNHEEITNKYVSNISYPNMPAYYKYHGTAVAITAAGATNNAEGKSAIGYNCSMSLASMNYNHLLQLSYSGVKVINISWASGCWYSPYLQLIVDEIYNNGTIIVAAAGNGGTCGGPTKLVYPAAFNHVIAVSSVGPYDNHQRQIGNPNSTHQHNSSVDICAPGYDVALSVYPGWYFTGNGTSFAAPYVTGTIGLMLSAAPCLTQDDVEYILKETAVNIDAENPAYIGQLGAGRLDAEAAVLMAQQLCSDDGNNGHGNDPGGFDPSNPGHGGGIGQGNNGNNGGNGGGIHINNGGGPSVSNGESSRTAEQNGVVPAFKGRVFPNPTREKAMVIWNAETAVEIVVSDMNGKTVHNEVFASDVNRMTLELDPGVYIVKLRTQDGQNWSERLVKL